MQSNKELKVIILDSGIEMEEINNVKITKNSIGTIKELTSINPSVSRSKKIIASISINNVPNIFGIWTYDCGT